MQIRKVVDVRWVEIIAEDKIRTAMENGDFDDLPGRGRPLDLADYFNTPAAERMGISVLKTAGILPPEVELLREIDLLEQRCSRSTNEKEKAALRLLIQTKRVSHAMLMEQRSRAARSSLSLESNGF